MRQAAPVCYDSWVSRPSDRAVSPSSPGVSPERAPGAAGALPSPDSCSAIDALIMLLGCEPKTSNLAIVRSRLLELGAEALPLLDRVWVSDDGGRAAGVARE